MKQRAGMSLVELMVALSLFSVLMATTLGFYRAQGNAFTEGNQRMTVMQNLRYGVNALEENLGTAGVGVPSKQPVIVYAGPNTLAFNADYATNQQEDVFAVYYDRGLEDDEVNALVPGRAITLPGTSFTYPDSAYFAGSGNSPAETIVFHFAPDHGTAREDDYVLYRQVNDRAPELVARRLLSAGAPFFRYYTVEEGGSGSPIREISANSLPAAHTAPINGSPADTGASALVDSIQAVRVTYAASNGGEGEGESIREITRLIRLPNAGLGIQRTCGSAPILGVTLSATGVSPSGSVQGHIRLSWPRALDEHAGEQDVQRYVIWRRTSASTAWGDPLVSVAPAGTSTYVYEDFSADPSQNYTYALAAQDCTPQFSEVVTSGSVDWVP